MSRRGTRVRGRLGEAEELLVRAYDLVADRPAAEARASIADSLAVLHLEQGLPVSAFRRASESYSVFMQLGRSYTARWPYIAAAQGLAMTGQVDLAKAKLAAHDVLKLPMVLLNETDLLRAARLDGRSRWRPPRRPSSPRGGGRPRRGDRRRPRRHERAPQPRPLGPRPPGGRPPRRARHPCRRPFGGRPRQLRERCRRPGQQSPREGVPGLRGLGHDPLTRPRRAQRPRSTAVVPAKLAKLPQPSRKPRDCWLVAKGQPLPPSA